MGVLRVAHERWTEDQTKRALFLYFQMPFGRLHQHAPEIIALAAELGRTPSSIAMKLSNFASLDPGIIASGRKGLAGASALDRAIFARFYGNWDSLVNELPDQHSIPRTLLPVSSLREVPQPFAGFAGPSEAERLVSTRRGQSFFRQAVMANFEERCCITGIADLRLLNASHIKPWQSDEANRHNPANGFALSATFDRAFDRGLVTINPDLAVRVSNLLLQSASDRTRNYFKPYDGKRIRSPTRFMPDPALLAWHNESVFLVSEIDPLRLNPGR